MKETRTGVYLSEETKIIAMLFESQFNPDVWMLLDFLLTISVSTTVLLGNN